MYTKQPSNKHGGARKGAGRPKKNNIAIQIRLPKEIIEKLEKPYSKTIIKIIKGE